MERLPRHIVPDHDLVKESVRKRQARSPKPEALGDRVGAVSERIDEKAKEIQEFEARPRLNRWWNSEVGEQLTRASTLLYEELDQSVDQVGDLLSTFSQDRVRYWGVFNLFERAVADPTVREKLPEHLEGQWYSDKDFMLATRLVEEASDKTIDPVFLREVLLWNRRLFNEAKQSLVEALPDMKQQLLERVDELASAGMFPITRDEFEKRTEDVVVEIGDGIGSGSTIAGMSPRSRILTFSHLLTPEERQETYVHEMIHAAGGRTILESASRSRHDTEDTELDPQRSGLRFTRYKTYQGTEGKERYPVGAILEWLDEGVTEHLALLLRTSRHGYYLKERSLFQELLDKGIPADLFYDAYFENYDPSTPEQAPAWRKLSHAITEALGERNIMKALVGLVAAARKREQEGAPEL